jgi:hypothetical protein
MVVAFADDHHVVRSVLQLMKQSLTTTSSPWLGKNRDA